MPVVKTRDLPPQYLTLPPKRGFTLAREEGQIGIGPGDVGLYMDNHYLLALPEQHAEAVITGILTAPGPVVDPADIAARSIRNAQDDPRGDFQTRATRWVAHAFGPDLARSHQERAYRFIEEAVELAQSTGVSRADLNLTADRVYAKAPGDLPNEVGGAALTLAALAGTYGLDLLTTAEGELARCERNTDAIRAKHATKTLIAGPIITPDPTGVALEGP